MSSPELCLICFHGPLYRSIKHWARELVDFVSKDNVQGREFGIQVVSWLPANFARLRLLLLTVENASMKDKGCTKRHLVVGA